MRQVILDTETTGLDVDQDHRIIEVGCVELKSRRKTGRQFHRRLNPQREIDAGAMQVHGMRSADLQDQPLFADIAQELLDFVRDSDVIIHNAPFDIGFLDRELSRLGGRWGRFGDHCRVVDSLTLARELHPGQKNGLDALCARYAVDNSRRELHGALLDAHLLADVYLAMTGGQGALLLDRREPESAQQVRASLPLEARLMVIGPSAAERDAHEQRLQDIERASGGKRLWPRDPAR